MRLIKKALHWLPWLLLMVSMVLVADEALAQSTGGSFGGGSFGGGGGGSSGGGGYSGGGDDGDGLVALIFYVVFSRLPWPLKLGAVVLIAGIWGGIKLARRRRRNRPDEEDDIREEDL